MGGCPLKRKNCTKESSANVNFLNKSLESSTFRSILLSNDLLRSNNFGVMLVLGAEDLLNSMALCGCGGG